MPLVTGRIEPGGPLVAVAVGVSAARRALLVKHQLPVPPAVHVRALIDTGSSHTLFSTRVFRELGVGPVAKELLLTPSTLPGQPHECDVFDTALYVLANGTPRPFGDRRVVGADCWLEGEEIEGLIGRDVLDHCNLQYLGPERLFILGF